VNLKGEVLVGFANESPFSYVDYRTGNLTGEAPVLLRHALASLGSTGLQGRLTRFGALVPGLQAGRFDLIAAGMYVTPARCQEVLFSEPTYCVGEALLVSKGNPDKLFSYPDLSRKHGVRVAVVRGTFEHFALQQTDLPAENIVIFPDAPSALSGLQAKRVAALALNSLAARDLMRKLGPHPTVQLVSLPDDQLTPPRGCGAFAFRKADRRARDALNDALRPLLGSKEHLQMVVQFGFTAAELPPPGLTTDELCRR
jgi:polar amino acid transport system substrate-binding protein